MADSDTWWEPPLAGSDEEHLIGALERLRATFRWKADGLDGNGLSTRIGASSLTIGGLLKHLAYVEDSVFTTRLRGEPGSLERGGGGDWELTSAADDAPEQLYALYDHAVASSRERLRRALADDDRRLDQLAHIHDDAGNHASLRRLVCDLVEEYGRHTGHADLIREAVDGLVGEDPPPGWRPSSGE